MTEPYHTTTRRPLSSNLRDEKAPTPDRQRFFRRSLPPTALPRTLVTPEAAILTATPPPGRMSEQGGQSGFSACMTLFALVESSGPMPTERRIHELFLLNLALQLFDGVATYQGLRVGWQEANPILLAAFQYLGVETTLVLFKAKACGLLLLLARQRHHRLVPPTLYLLASVYCSLSLVPWLTKFLILFVESL